MKRTTTFILAFILLIGASVAALAQAAESAGTAQGDEADEKLVRVNQHVITRKELDVHLTVFHLTPRLRQQLPTLSPSEQEQFYGQRRKEALRDLVERRLMLEQARTEYLAQPRVKKAIEMHVAKLVRAKARELRSLMTMHLWLREHGLTLEEWKALLTDSTLVQHYMWEKIESRLHVSPGEIRRYYEEHKATLRRPRRVIYRMILVDPEGCETAEQERAKADVILEKIRAGADFAEVAEKYSLDRDTTEGGLREQDAPQTPDDWLPPCCVGLQAGQVSEPRRTQAGYCITKLERILPSRIPSFEQAEVEARQILLDQKRVEAKKALMKKLRESAHVQYFPAGKQMAQ